LKEKESKQKHKKPKNQNAIFGGAIKRKDLLTTKL
jgi:hypothetical protein